MFKYATDSVKSLWSNFNIASGLAGVVTTLVVIHFVN